MRETTEPTTLDTEAEQEVALTRSAEERVEAALATIDQLAATEAGLEIFNRRQALLERARQVSIRVTKPEDWVLFRDKQGNEIAMLTAAGAQRAADIYGVVVHNLQPVDNRGLFAPEVIFDPKRPGVFTVRAWADAFSRSTGRSIQALEFSRRSDEDFTGRGQERAGDSDLRSAVQTGLHTKAVRVLAGLSRVPLADLEAAGLDVSKCRRGSGYGTSSERTAQAVAEGDVQAEAKRLGDEILRRVGGDKAAASDLLHEITVSKEGKFGKRSIAQFTKNEQVKWAWERLIKHPEFGDAAQSREPGEE